MRVQDKGRQHDDDTEELLVLVDESDREIGQRRKTDCHVGDGVLHRAFSVFLFNERGELLIQQRAPGKMLWGGYWSNSCCSHPRPGEAVEEAARRRVREELAVDCELQFLYKFRYHARFGDVGSENELCHVYAGWLRDDPAALRADPAEISAWRWIEPGELGREVAASPERFSPWFKLEWERIGQDFLEDILARAPKGT